MLTDVPELGTYFSVLEGEIMRDPSSVLLFLLKLHDRSIPDEPADTWCAFLGHQDVIISLIAMPG